MASSRFKPLPYRLRAELFLQLSRLEAAGLPYGRAVAMVKLPAPGARRLKTLQALAARGIDAAKAGEQSGIFTMLEARLVRAALDAGSPARIYQRFAEYYSQRAMQWHAMKSRMMMPAFVLLLALMVPPVPALVTGKIGVVAYAWQVVWPLLAIAAVVVVLRWLGSQDGASRGKSLYQLVPFYGPIFVRANLRDFFETLALMLEAGIPMLAALPVALQTVSDGDIRRQLVRVRQRVEKGEAFSAGLDDVPYLRRSAAPAFAQTGEASGTLPEMLMRHAAMETEVIGHFYEQLATWLPRILYFLVSIKIAAGILSSEGVVPRVPADL